MLDCVLKSARAHDLQPALPIPYALHLNLHRYASVHFSHV